MFVFVMASSIFIHCHFDCFSICLPLQKPRADAVFRSNEFLMNHSIISILQKTMQQNKRIIKEAFRERRHFHVCDLWPWVVTLLLSQGQKGLCHYSCCLLYCTLVPGIMSVSVIVCKIWPFVHFCDLRLWPSSSVKVTFIFIIR